MFKKPNRNKNIRRGETSLDQIEHDEADEKVEKPIKPPKAALLSFVHEGELNVCLCCCQSFKNICFQMRRTTKCSKSRSHH